MMLIEVEKAVKVIEEAFPYSIVEANGFAWDAIKELLRARSKKKSTVVKEWFFGIFTRKH